MRSAAGLPPPLLEVARGQGGLVSAAQCEEHGVLTSRRSRLVAAGTWKRPARGVYDTHERDATMHEFDQERWRTVWLALKSYPRSAAVGEIALMMHGAEGLPRRLTAEVALPGGTYARPRAGVRVRQVDLHGHAVKVLGRHAARAPLALVQAMRTLSRDSWVQCADSLLNKKVISAQDLVEVRALARRAGLVARLHWADLVDGRAESPLETEARLRCVDAGFPPDDLQREFRDGEGKFLGRADLVWHLGDGRWLIAEIDGGAFHSSDDQLGRDAVRQNDLLEGGRTIVLRFRSAHLRQPQGLTERIGRVLTRSGWQPGRALPT
ncbi:type IV toxin-antitoxin system AbiEi family antitoxin domain-containing protein [Promicromonospora kroppenstedtii]|uniref:Type IV toxin-antitoxin system AbiEi family antitoxin domain-containing protein n=1 Tax=Promicromonospora kroppenstedtii TaxID=440482 RepID=A0ABW7XQN2_9MICO